MPEPLPTFRYHPDPVATGSVEASDGRCPRCEQARGFAYVGPVHADEDVEGLCPWCIADGSAAERFDAEFTEVDGEVPDEVLVELTQRTPGFTGWQEERWLVHCDEGAAYLGRIGYDELAAHPDALAMVRDEVGDDHTEALHPDGDATGYLFRCLHCGAHLAYADAN
jgi:uncharacterized protein CbrC (UPF0167 family)